MNLNLIAIRHLILRTLANAKFVTKRKCRDHHDDHKLYCQNNTDIFSVEVSGHFVPGLVFGNVNNI